MIFVNYHLQTIVHDMIETNKQKNLIGSAMAGSVGGKY